MDLENGAEGQEKAIYHLEVAFKVRGTWDQLMDLGQRITLMRNVKFMWSRLEAELQDDDARSAAARVADHLRRHTTGSGLGNAADLDDAQEDEYLPF